MGTAALEVRDLCIDYRPFKSTTIRRSFLKKKEKQEMIHAVKNLSFTMEKGEILGVVGKNGSGKSTLLRAIAGIFVPDKGSIDLHGNTVSLLSIGVGFNRELTGRENIILSGMLLGFNEVEISERMDEIIDFSELGKFVDYPVRTYSSGMYSKLAFAISVMLETDITLIDEVLSVGDERFRKKSFNKMKDLITDRDRTVIIVSHSMETLTELCTRMLWIDSGEFKMIGEVSEVAKEYKKFMAG